MAREAARKAPFTSREKGLVMGRGIREDWLTRSALHLRRCPSPPTTVKTAPPEVPHHFSTQGRNTTSNAQVDLCCLCSCR